MRIATLSIGFLAMPFFASPAVASEPVGEWLVAEKTARIRVVECAGALWGVVAWEQDPGVDGRNPDVRLRSRPALGMPVILGMRKVEDGWDGRIYNSENGKTYSGGVRMNRDGTLHIFGCVLSILCGGEDWARTQPMADGLDASGDALCARLRDSP